MSDPDRRRRVVRAALEQNPATPERFEAVIRKLTEDALRQLPRERTALWLAALADAPIRDLEGVDSFYITDGRLFLVQTKTRAHGYPSTAKNPPEEKAHSVDYQHAALILLAVLAWLVYFVGPALISKQPSADQPTTNDYWSLVPGIAVALTGYILAQRKRK